MDLGASNCQVDDGNRKLAIAIGNVSKSLRRLFVRETGVLRNRDLYVNYNCVMSQQVVLKGLPPKFLDDLLVEDQEAISKALGKPMTLNGYEDDGRAELEFRDTEGSRDHQIEMISAVDTMDLHPVMDIRFPLTEIQDAFRLQESRRHFGQICLTYIPLTYSSESTISRISAVLQKLSPSGLCRV